MAKYDGIDGESNPSAFMDLDVRKAGTAWTPYPGAAALARRVRALHPAGVDGILIGLLKVPGYQINVSSNGIIAILVGLLLPAVQKMAGGTSADLQWMSSALASTGAIGFALADGSVRPAAAAAPIASAIRSPQLSRSTGKVRYNATDWDFMLIVSPRDPASGQATGKRIF